MDFLDSIDKILPVFFFIAWVIFGAFVKGKKRKEPSPGETPRSSGIGDLKKTLQKVLREMQEPVAPVEPDSPSFETTLEEIASQENRVQAEPETADGGREWREPLPSSLPSPALPVRADTRSLLRQGVILSEILAPPVALRE